MPTGRPTAATSSGRRSTGTSRKAATASPTSASHASIPTVPAAHGSSTSTWCDRATATGTRPSGGRPTAPGFLYTETVDTAINPELFFCRLRDPARGPCQPVRLTTDPAWDEQAIFSKDMHRVIFMSSRDLPGAHQDWARVATLLDLPADYDYALVLTVFSDNFLQPVLQQATDFYEMTLRWNRSRTRFKPGPIRRLTTSGEQGWVIPEFAWDPAGRRLLWTQNRVGGGRRVDQGCVMRELRSAFIQQLSGVDSVAKIPLDLGRTIRNQAAELLRAPGDFAYRGACGTAPTPGELTVERETWIGRFED